MTDGTAAKNRAIRAVEDLYEAVTTELDDAEGVVEMLQAELETRTTERDEAQATLASVQASYVELDHVRQADLAEVDRVRGLYWEAIVTVHSAQKALEDARSGARAELHNLQSNLDSAHEDLAQEYDRRKNAEAVANQWAENDFDGYQSFTDTTAIYPRETTTEAITYLALGIVGEAGEVAEKVKKAIRDDAGAITPEREAGIIAELGDLTWYIARMADELCIDLSAVIEINRAKLTDRKDRGVIGGSGDAR